MALGVASYFLFSLQDASNKWLVATVPVWQVLFFRSLLIVLGSLAVGRSRLVEEIVASKLKWELVLRGVITLVAWLCYYSAARDLPLAQLLTLYFAAPLMVAALSQRLLGERVTKLRWLSIGIGFSGVLVASDPFGVRLGWPTVLVLIAACGWGYGVILMRQIARRERSLVQMVVSNLVFTVATGVMCVVSWVRLSTEETLLIAVVAGCGGLAQFLSFEAARRAPAAVMATVQYSSLLWAFILGFVIWHDIPTLSVWGGAALIVVAGAVLLISERQAAARR